ncbi:MAG: AsmA-like C-terminal region-containing protein [Verrucomicrobia bacterium]|nr:AsmA-like C-terminal region-containing protein [Verrucomicrobiota bacterium]
MRTFFRRLIVLLVLAGALGAYAMVRSEGFAQTWRDFVVEQLEQRGVYLKMDSLHVDLLQGGLVVKGIQVYLEATHQTLLASVDRLNLDLDIGKLLHQKVQVQGLDLRQANVVFPIDPEDPKSERLSLEHLNARVLLTGDRIEIRRAEGKFFGLQLGITGTLLRQSKPASDDEDRKARENMRLKIAELRKRRDLILEAAKILQHFQTAREPRLEIEVNGDLDKPEELNASLHLTANGLRHGDYVCEELEARATYAGRLVDLTSLRIRDQLGELNAGALYEIGGDSVDFHLHSTMNLPQLASAILENQALHEVVFYEPPEITADGRVLLGKLLPADAFVPVTMGLQAMWKKADGFRYRGQLQMDPTVFEPFLSHPQMRDFIKRFAFREDSSIFAELEGEGASTDIGNDCRNRGRVELHHFKYQGVEFARMESDMEFEGPQHWFRNMRMERAEGVGLAQQIDWDDYAGTVKFTGLVSDLEPVAVVGCFVESTAQVIARYRFDKHPHVEMDGLIDNKRGGTNLRVKFRSEGTAHYELWGNDYIIGKPAGDLKFTGTRLTYTVSGGAFGKDMICKGDTALGENVSDYNVDFRTGSFPYSVFAKMLPFEKVAVKVACKNGVGDIDVKARVLDGDLSFRGKFDDRKTPLSYSGDLRINSINFRKFAKVYSPDYETDGDITAHAEFSGKMGDWKSLKGKGAIVILNGNLYAIPILGPLTPLLGAMLPTPIGGFNVAKDADATFTLADGFATTDDLVASTKVFHIASKGQIDYVEDRIQFHAQVKFGRLLGLVLFPVSKILEYTAEGTVGDPKWRPRFFSASSEKSPFRKSDDSETPQPVIKPGQKPVMTPKPANQEKTPSVPRRVK